MIIGKEELLNNHTSLPKENNITKTALMIIGDAVKGAKYDRSKLYDPGFTTEFREATR